jgi:hypothetical protein
MVTADHLRPHICAIASRFSGFEQQEVRFLYPQDPIRIGIEGGNTKTPVSAVRRRVVTGLSASLTRAQPESCSRS